MINKISKNVNLYSADKVRHSNVVADLFVSSTPHPNFISPLRNTPNTYLESRLSPDKGQFYVVLFTSNCDLTSRYYLYILYCYLIGFLKILIQDRLELLTKPSLFRFFSLISISATQAVTNSTIELVLILLTYFTFPHTTLIWAR